MQLSENLSKQIFIKTLELQPHLAVVTRCMVFASMFNFFHLLHFSTSSLFSDSVIEGEREVLFAP